jgi:hypothetical protein
MWSPLAGKNKRDMWVKVDEKGKRIGMAHLGAIADLVSLIFLSLAPVTFSEFPSWVPVLI